ncbi:MAG TPA: single-stranded DNA-binding protein [Blastocatellia bacterium]|nr:single-stranded DNA-binding protein [Blastocatellia bacterium]
MASFNKIIIVGYLGRDPELRYTPQGTPVCDFSIATTERRKDKSGEFQDHTTWFRVSLFGRQAEVASQYLSKGRQVYIEGSLTQREYTDKEGNARTSLDVRGSDLQFIGTAGDGEHAPAARATATSAPAPRKEAPARPAPAPVDEDDIPF